MAFAKCKQNQRSQIIQGSRLVRLSLIQSCQVIGMHLNIFGGGHGETIISQLDPHGKDASGNREVSVRAHWDLGGGVSELSGTRSCLAKVQGDEDVKMLIERWALTQAFAYDEYGHGFLTLRSRPVNVELRLQQLYARWDLPMVARIFAWRRTRGGAQCVVIEAREFADQLYAAFDRELFVQDRRSPASAEHAGAAEPLIDLFDYGRLAFSNDEVSAFRHATCSKGVPLFGACSPFDAGMSGYHTSRIPSAQHETNALCWSQFKDSNVFVHRFGPCSGLHLSTSPGSSIVV